MRMHKKLTSTADGFAIVEMIVLFMGMAIIGFVSWYVWESKTKADRSFAAAVVAEVAPSSTATDVAPANWRVYKDADLGFRFNYPSSWGTASVKRQALNNEKYEINLPYIVSFSDSAAPTARIVPTDWKFTPPGASEWNHPIERASLDSKEDDTMVIISKDNTAIASIYFDAFSGAVLLSGVRTVNLPGLKAKQVELHRKDTIESKKICLETRKNSYGSEQQYATVACYSRDYQKDFVRVLNSFAAL